MYVYVCMYESGIHPGAVTANQWKLTYLPYTYYGENCGEQKKDWKHAPRRATTRDCSGQTLRERLEKKSHVPMRRQWETPEPAISRV